MPSFFLLLLNWLFFQHSKSSELIDRNSLPEFPQTNSGLARFSHLHNKAAEEIIEVGGEKLPDEGREYIIYRSRNTFSEIKSPFLQTPTTYSKWNAILKTRNLIFVSGAPRSGTDWVGRILSVPLVSNVRFPVSNRHCVGCIREPFNPDSRGPDWCVGTKTWVTPFRKQYEWMGASNLTDMTKKKNFLQSVLYICSNVLKNDTKTPMIIKDPIGLFSSEWIWQHFNAKILILVRNPISWISSMKKQEFWGIPHCVRRGCSDSHFVDSFFERGAEKLKYFGLESFSSVLKSLPQFSKLQQTALVSKIFFSVFNFYYEKYSNNPKWKFVRWEDLATQPEKTFSEILDWTGVEMTPRIYDEINKTTALPLEMREALTAKRRSAFSVFRNSTSLLTEWENYLSQEDVDEVIDIIGNETRIFYPNLKETLEVLKQMQF